MLCHIFCFADAGKDKLKSNIEVKSGGRPLTAMKPQTQKALTVTKRKLASLSLSFILLASLLSGLIPGQMESPLCQSASAQASQSAVPRLVVLIVADQFPYSYLERYKNRLSQGGFRFLLEQGANFTNCKYKSATTHAACGHSVISTGAHPWSTGVVGNQWYSRGSKGPKPPTGDNSSTLVGANGTAGGLKYVAGTTMGDQLKLATNGRSKVFSASVDQSSSLLLGGQLATNAFWMDPKTGNMVSSSKYGSTLPGWAKAFNDQHIPDRYIGKPWQRLMPETQYGASTSDSYSRERAMPGDGKRFPHIINRGEDVEDGGYYSNFAMTPFANQMVLDFAKSMIEKERMGQHTDADFVALGLTAGEQLTQHFGPYSQETEDLVLRMDRSLESFFQFVDTNVGLSNCLIVFTASHGSPAIPEFLGERGMTAGRIDPKIFTTFLDSKLDSQIGEEDWIDAFYPPNLYLNFDAMDNQKVRQPDVESLVSKIAHSVPGIGDIVTAYQLYANQSPNGPKTEAVKKSYYFGRSGELYVMPKPGFVFTEKSDGTGYGSPYSYDTQVPLILYGAGIKPGKFGTTTSPADVSATVAGLLNIETPSLCEGRALDEAFAQVDGPPLPRVKPQAPSKDAAADKDKRKRR